MDRLRPGRRRRVSSPHTGRAVGRLAIGSRRGRRGRIARRGAGAGRFRVAVDAGPTVVDEHSRRGAPDADLPNTRQGRHCRRQQRDRAGWKPGDVALTRGTEHYLFADDPGHQTDGRSSIPASAAPRCPATTLRFEMSLGVRTWGNSAQRGHPVGHLRLRGAERGQRPAARCAADRVGAARTRSGTPR